MPSKRCAVCQTPIPTTWTYCFTCVFELPRTEQFEAKAERIEREIERDKERDQ